MKMQQKKEVPDVILKFNKLALPPVVANNYFLKREKVQTIVAISVFIKSRQPANFAVY
jgi:hypothetical protein